MSESVAQHLDLVVTSIGDVDVKLDTARQEVEVDILNIFQT